MSRAADVRALAAVSGGRRLAGQWFPGELLGTWRLAWPPVLPLTRLDACRCEVPQCRAALLGNASVVAVHEIDWPARTGRLEIGVAPTEQPHRSLDLALAYAFDTLNLDRVWGWVCDEPTSPREVLTAAGLACEATLPAAMWLGNQFVDREIWGRRSKR